MLQATYNKNTISTFASDINDVIGKLPLVGTHSPTAGFTEMPFLVDGRILGCSIGRAGQIPVDKRIDFHKKNISAGKKKQQMMSTIMNCNCNYNYIMLTPPP